MNDVIKVQIDSDVPMPEKHSYTRKGYAEALRQLKPGDSALFAGRTAAQLTSAAAAVLGKGNYICRTVEGGARVWRRK